MQLWISAGKETQETPQLWQRIDKKKEYQNLRRSNEKKAQAS